MFRSLNADEIETRIQIIKESGLSLLLYKDARCDMRILDETVGPQNWSNTFEIIGGNLYCTVSIWDKEKSQWISKTDVGVESFSDKEKGNASDARKRAGFCWGIGRELYTAPFIWIDSDKYKSVYDESKKRHICKDSFYVSKLSVDNERIIELEIKNEKTGVVCFYWNFLDRKKSEFKQQLIEKCRELTQVHVDSGEERQVASQEVYRLLLDHVEANSLDDMDTSQLIDGTNFLISLLEVTNGVVCE